MVPILYNRTLHLRTFERRIYTHDETTIGLFSRGSAHIRSHKSHKFQIGNWCLDSIVHILQKIHTKRLIVHNLSPPRKTHL